MIKRTRRIFSIEFNSQDDSLQTFGIKRCLFLKGTPIYNVVAEATFKLFKKELVNDVYFDSLEQLPLELGILKQST